MKSFTKWDTINCIQMEISNLQAEKKIKLREIKEIEKEIEEKEKDLEYEKEN